MTKSYFFRSLADEIRRFWLARPPQRRTPSCTEEFSSELWVFGLHAGSRFDLHRAQVVRALEPLLTAPSEADPSFES